MSSRFMLAGLKEARERLGMSQEQAARACSTSASAYQRWERGIANPPAAKAEEVAAALRCSLYELVHGFDAPAAEAAAPRVGLPQSITREEFDELRAKVDRLLERPAEHRPSLYHDASEIAERLGLVDELGRAVSAGCHLVDGPTGGRRRKVAAIEISEPRSMPGSGLASVACVMDDGSRVSAVDMRVKGMVQEKAGR